MSLEPPKYVKRVRDLIYLLAADFEQPCKIVLDGTESALIIMVKSAGSCG